MTWAYDEPWALELLRMVGASRGMSSCYATVRTAPTGGASCCEGWVPQGRTGRLGLRARDEIRPGPFAAPAAGMTPEPSGVLGRLIGDVLPDEQLDHLSLAGANALSAELVDHVG